MLFVVTVKVEPARPVVTSAESHATPSTVCGVPHDNPARTAEVSWVAKRSALTELDVCDGAGVFVVVCCDAMDAHPARVTTPTAITAVVANAIARREET